MECLKEECDTPLSTLACTPSPDHVLEHALVRAARDLEEAVRAPAAEKEDRSTGRESANIRELKIRSCSFSWLPDLVFQLFAQSQYFSPFSTPQPRTYEKKQDETRVIE
jgi:hypothetical protein